MTHFGDQNQGKTTHQMYCDGGSASTHCIHGRDNTGGFLCGGRFVHHKHCEGADVGPQWQILRCDYHQMRNFKVYILANPRITSHVQVGLELSKVLFTDAELAVSTLTGR